jgi:hypothetical protein
MSLALVFGAAMMMKSRKVELTNRSVAAQVSSGTATAGVELTTAGALSERRNNAYTSIAGEWTTPIESGIGSHYEVRATHTGGTVPTGPAMGTWHTIDFNRQWNISRTTNGETTSTFTLEIRHKAAQVVVASANISLNAIFGIGA